MIITTTPNIEGKPIRAYRGIVVGEAIMGANVVRDVFASITDIVGGVRAHMNPSWKTPAKPHSASWKSARCPRERMRLSASILIMKWWGNPC